MSQILVVEDVSGDTTPTYSPPHAGSKRGRRSKLLPGGGYNELMMAAAAGWS